GLRGGGEALEDQPGRGARGARGRGPPPPPEGLRGQSRREVFEGAHQGGGEGSIRLLPLPTRGRLRPEGRPARPGREVSREVALLRRASRQGEEGACGEGEEASGSASGGPREANLHGGS